MNEEGDALLQAILGDPFDDAPRLVYADWLEENGEPERAEFIRVQIELEPLRMHGHGISHPHGGQCSTCDRAARLEWRERKLMETGHSRWFPCPVSLDSTRVVRSDGRRNRIAWTLDSGTVYAETNRGFSSTVRLPLAAFLGGPCKRCGGTGFPGGEPSHMMEHSPRLCRYCNATGRTEGVARRLFEIQPVTKVVLTDREPAPVAGSEAVWATYGSPDQFSYWLPHEFWDLLIGYISYGWPSQILKKYPSREDALAALSAACVKYGRELVGLPT